ncbi:DMT family transporter [SAR116 cluster bacterium]|nr:DMT family transporter [SAR116 cluster bacterium]
MTEGFGTLFDKRRSGRIVPWLIILTMGTSWGLGFSLAKIAFQAGGLPIGVAFWQLLIATILVFCLTNLLRDPVPFTPHHLRNYLLVSILATSIPATCFMFAAGQVPAGIIAITIAIVPMLTYAFMVILSKEKVSLVRMSGIACGAVAILLIVVPETSLPSREAIPWILVACIGPLCHALNNINLTRPAVSKISPLHLIFGGNLLGAAILAPIAIATDQMFMPSIPFGRLEWAIMGIAVINSMTYAVFIMVIKHAGPVFASQTGYLVTICGVFWGMYLFDEAHSSWVWAALITMIIGVSLVSPRRAKPRPADG